MRFTGLCAGCCSGGWWRSNRQIRIWERRRRRLHDHHAEALQRALRLLTGEREEAAVVPDPLVQLDRARLVACVQAPLRRGDVVKHRVVAGTEGDADRLLYREWTEVAGRAVEAGEDPSVARGGDRRPPPRGQPPASHAFGASPPRTPPAS